MIGHLRKSAQNGRQPLEQIIRRISIRHDLMDRADGADGGGDGETLFSLEEIRAMYGKNKMRLAPDAARFLMLLANVPKNGHLGACSAVVKLAVRANSGETVLTMDMLKHMMRYTEFRGAYRLIAAKMEQGTGSLKLKIG